MTGMGTGSRPTFNGGGGNWFDTVTGSNDFERQSWRDAFNGGQAAGDLTGNTNARLDAERRAFGGATWTGSSTQLSARELARAMGAPGVQATASTGPGVAAVAAGPPGPVIPGPGGVVPPSVVRVTDLPPLKPDLKPTATSLMLGGGWWQANPWFSDADQWEQRYGEPGDWIGGVGTALVDTFYNAQRLGDWATRRELNGAIPSGTVDPDPQYQDGWVSYDERQTWERAPQGSPANQYWSF